MLVGLMLPPVVEDGVFLGLLPLGVLHIVHVEYAEGDGQCGEDDQQRHRDREDVCEAVTTIRRCLTILKITFLTFPPPHF